MSWQQYVDSSLVGTGFCAKGALLGLDAIRAGAANCAWAISAGFNIPTAEAQALAKIFDDPSTAFSGGIKIAGEKYMAIRADARSAYGKKVGRNT